VSSERQTKSVTGSRLGTNTLVVQTAFLGDLLLGIPMFKELRRLRPNDRLFLLCREGLGEPMLRFGLFDKVIEADKKSRRSWRDAVHYLRSKQFEWVISPHESMRTMLMLSLLKSQHKVGYSHWMNRFLFTDRIERPLRLPEALRQIALLAPLDPSVMNRLNSFEKTQERDGGRDAKGGLLPVPPWADMTIPHLTRLHASRRKANSAGGNSLFMSNQAADLSRQLSSESQIIFMAPGSVWATKMWTEEGYSYVAQKFIDRGFQVVLMGSRSERQICNRIVEKAPGAISFAGETSLTGSFELLALADLLICNDSGSMHMAAAAGVPTISVFGPTILRFGYRPWQTTARVVQTNLSCRPCGKHGADVCPIGTHACMKEVSGELVWKEALALMADV
jgi:heptosyltransferase-2